VGVPTVALKPHLICGAAAARYAMGPDRDRAQERRAAIAAMLSPEQLGEAQQQLAERDGAMTAGASAGGEAAVVKTAAPAR
jgi:hypothetical protein